MNDDEPEREDDQEGVQPRRRREKPLDEEVRDWDIDITSSDGPVLEEGDDLDTGGGKRNARP